MKRPVTPRRRLPTPGPVSPICGSGHPYLYFKKEETEGERSQVDSPGPHTRPAVQTRWGPRLPTPGPLAFPLMAKGPTGQALLCPGCPPVQQGGGPAPRTSAGRAEAKRGEGLGSLETRSVDGPPDRKAEWLLEFSFPLKHQVAHPDVHTMVTTQGEPDRALQPPSSSSWPGVEALPLCSGGRPLPTQALGRDAAASRQSPTGILRNKFMGGCCPRPPGTAEHVPPGTGSLGTPRTGSGCQAPRGWRREGRASLWAQAPGGAPARFLLVRAWLPSTL